MVLGTLMTRGTLAAAVAVAVAAIVAVAVAVSIPGAASAGTAEATETAERDPELVFWFFFLLLVGAPAAAMAGWLLGGVRRRRRRPPPTLPGLWWLCDGCRSVNDPRNERCYACGRVHPAHPETIRTAEHFEMVQKFGGTRHDGVAASEPGVGPRISAPDDEDLV